MNPDQVKSKAKEMFAVHNFELVDDYVDGDEGYLALSFLKKDFRVEFSLNNSECNLTLDKPFYGFDETYTVSTWVEIEEKINKFINKVDQALADDNLLPIITTKDADLFLKTGSYDGMASGVIEHQGTLYYIEAATNVYYKDRSAEDRQNRIWRTFYVYELSQTELEKVIMSTLDWMRRINLTALCKDWQSLSTSTGEESEHRLHFDGKYRYSHNPINKPIKKLQINY